MKSFLKLLLVFLWYYVKMKQDILPGKKRASETFELLSILGLSPAASALLLNLCWCPCFFETENSVQDSFPESHADTCAQLSISADVCLVSIPGMHMRADTCLAINTCQHIHIYIWANRCRGANSSWCMKMSANLNMSTLPSVQTNADAPSAIWYVKTHENIRSAYDRSQNTKIHNHLSTQAKTLTTCPT